MANRMYNPRDFDRHLTKAEADEAVKMILHYVDLRRVNADIMTPLRDIAKALETKIALLDAAGAGIE